MLWKGDRCYEKVIDIMARQQILWKGGRCCLWLDDRCYGKVTGVVYG